MIFAELIAESLDSMADLTWKIQSFDPGLTTARFEIKDVQVEVRFEERGDWTVSFEVLYGASQAVYTAFHIYNAVFQAVEEFIATRQPDVLVFATKREELADVYDLYLRKGQEKIMELGYRLRPVSTIDLYREHSLVRVKPSQWT